MLAVVSGCTVVDYVGFGSHYSAIAATKVKSPIAISMPYVNSQLSASALQAILAGQHQSLAPHNPLGRINSEASH